MFSWKNNVETWIDNVDYVKAWIVDVEIVNSGNERCFLTEVLNFFKLQYAES